MRCAAPSSLREQEAPGGRPVSFASFVPARAPYDRLCDSGLTTFAELFVNFLTKEFKFDAGPHFSGG